MWKEYVQPIVFAFEDAPLYPGKKTSFGIHQCVTSHWLDIQNWVHQQLGYTFALMTPMNVAANPSANGMSGSGQNGNQLNYNQWSVYKELHNRGIIDLANPSILYYIHTWGPQPEFGATGAYDGHAWGYEHDAGRCLDAPCSLVSVCSIPFWEIINSSGGHGGVGRWSNDLARGRCLHEVCHGMNAVPDLTEETGKDNPMWAWWDWPKTKFNDEQKLKLLKSRWMWVK